MAILGLVEEPPEGSDGGCQHCRQITKKRLDDIFAVLPAVSVEEIATKTGIDPTAVEASLAHLRRHSLAHGWTVPHARRGRTTKDRRFYAMLVGKDGQGYLDADTRLQVKIGLYGTVIEAASKCENEAQALRVTSHYIKQRRERRRVEDYAEDLLYMARKGRVLYEELGEDMEEMA